MDILFHMGAEEISWWETCKEFCVRHLALFQHSNYLKKKRSSEAAGSRTGLICFWKAILFKFCFKFFSLFRYQKHLFPVYFSDFYTCDWCHFVLQWHRIRQILSYTETHADPEEVGVPEEFLYYFWCCLSNIICIQVSVLTLQFLPDVPTCGRC